jgi:hypothetical protein
MAKMMSAQSMRSAEMGVSASSLVPAEAVSTPGWVAKVASAPRCRRYAGRCNRATHLDPLKDVIERQLNCSGG